MKHTIKFTIGAAILLKNILLIPEAVKGIQNVYNAGTILNILDGLDENVSNLSNDWTVTDLTEGQREVCKSTILFAVDKGFVRPSNYINELIVNFGLN